MLISIQDPGRIFPGKKMAGGMGGKFKTTPPVKVSTQCFVIFVTNFVNCFVVTRRDSFANSLELSATVVVRNIFSESETRSVYSV